MFLKFIWLFAIILLYPSSSWKKKAHIFNPDALNFSFIFSKKLGKE